MSLSVKLGFHLAVHVSHGFHLAVHVSHGLHLSSYIDAYHLVYNHIECFFDVTCLNYDSQSVTVDCYC